MESEIMEAAPEVLEASPVESRIAVVATKHEGEFIPRVVSSSPDRVVNSCFSITSKLKKR